MDAMERKLSGRQGEKLKYWNHKRDIKEMFEIYIKYLNKGLNLRLCMI